MTSPSSWVTIAGAPAAVRWDDGTVLVFGGRDGGGAATAAIWRFRPRLLGPLTGAVTVVPGDGTSDPPLTPLDPSAVDRAAGWVLGGPAPSWAIVGGPSAGTARLDLNVTMPATGLDVLVGFVGPADHDDLVLVPGQAAILERVRAGQRGTLCRGTTVPAAGPSAITVDLAGTSVRAVVTWWARVSARSVAAPKPAPGV